MNNNPVNEMFETFWKVCGEELHDNLTNDDDENFKIDVGLTFKTGFIEGIKTAMTCFAAKQHAGEELSYESLQTQLTMLLITALTATDQVTPDEIKQLIDQSFKKMKISLPKEIGAALHDTD